MEDQNTSYNNKKKVRCLSGNFVSWEITDLGTSLSTSYQLN